MYDCHQGLIMSGKEWQKIPLCLNDNNPFYFDQSLYFQFKIICRVFSPQRNVLWECIKPSSISFLFLQKDFYGYNNPTWKSFSLASSTLYISFHNSPSPLISNQQIWFIIPSWKVKWYDFLTKHFEHFKDNFFTYWILYF